MRQHPHLIPPPGQPAEEQNPRSFPRRPGELFQDDPEEAPGQRVANDWCLESEEAEGDKIIQDQKP